MKKVLLMAVLMTATATASVVHADTAEVGEVFLGIQAGHSQFASNPLLTPRQSGLFVGSRENRVDRSDVAFGISGGYRWPVSEFLKLGIEGGYIDLGEASARYDLGQDFGTTHVYSTQKRHEKVKAPFVGFNGRWIIGDDWSLTARVGVAGYRSSTDVDNTSTISSSPSFVGHENDERTSVSYYYGLSFGYDITSQLGIALSFDRYNPEFKGQLNGQSRKYSARVTVPGLRLEYRFQ